MAPFQKSDSRDTGRSARSFEQIVGNSRSLEVVLAQVERVAVTDSTVLILGETGTGKELIARAIHNISPRCGRPFIKLNCAAIPFDLLESDLFGHEKGAFTGAIAQRLGRFELADTGTLFLDEVGDIPLALQSKLLRVLQEQEFERLGGEKTRHVNVRLVAATHRNLSQMVKQNRFRSDLFYRLHVFPVQLPALRERREDIAPLVRHYVEFFAQRMGKRIECIPAETMASFKSYSWPGNVRELQNLVERAVILSDGEVLPNPLSPETTEVTTDMSPGTMFHASVARLSCPERFSPVEPRTLALSQTERVLNILEETDWLIGGPRGAAVKLAPL
jgi:transcriptional regulator with GAF, ATPase, and Fis domain